MDSNFNTGGDKETFIRSILRNPFDQVTRGVFADWLDEHGDPDRATLIRENESYAWDTGRAASYATYRIADAIQGVAWEAKGGFVCKIFTTEDKFFELAPVFFRFHPITEVHLTDRYPIEREGTLQRETDPWPKNGVLTWDWSHNHERPSHPASWLITTPLFELTKLLYPESVRTWQEANNPNCCGWVEHKTKYEALEALSLAAVNYGRNLVGLPPLERKNESVVYT
jgi:uncharacterized protein (TIGR02996 family)